MTEYEPYRARQELVWTPRVKGRPRTMFIKGGYRTFTPHETVAAEQALRSQWVGQPIEGPIAVGLMMTDTRISVSILTCPEPTSTKLRRGDIDNYAKLILDALNGRAWLDDRQIVSLSVKKM